MRVELEVEPAALTAAASALRAGGYALGEPVAQAGVVVVRGAARTAVPVLLETLVAAGIPVYRASAESAELEDIYYALVGDVGAE